MKRRLPPLNALRVFEVAARYESFTEAAKELNVTQTAVSKQVAQLESYLGYPVFIRGHKSLSLTEAGRVCEHAVTQSFDHLQQKLFAPNKDKPQRVTILADVDFARLWLFPLLPELEKSLPGIQISLQTQNYTQPIDADETFDLAISWGRGKWKNLAYEPLFTNEVFPVCAPGFFGTEKPDMSRIPASKLIHNRDTYWWQIFLDRFGIDSIDVEAGRFFAQSMLCLDAAARSDGIALGDEVTTRIYLEQGSLVVPFPERLPSPDAYYMLAPDRAGFTTEPVKSLRGWLVKEATKHRLWFSEFWVEP